MADLTAQRRFPTLSSSPFSGLNPSAEEFVPSFLLSPLGLSSPATQRRVYVPRAFRAGSSDHSTPRRRKNSFHERSKRFERIPMDQYGESVRRTVFISDLDQKITEEQLAESLSCCGRVLDCRICGDYSNVLRFAFVEYANENGAKQALNLDGNVIGNHPVKVIPSKTPIVPVNPIFLPRSEDEREQCARTVYCSNIDKQVGGVLLSSNCTHIDKSGRDMFLDNHLNQTKTLACHVHQFEKISLVKQQLDLSYSTHVIRTVSLMMVPYFLQLSPAEVKDFFESLCGQVSRLRLLSDQGNSSCISFIEFAEAESSIAALNCTGLFLGSNAIRVSPSKTPIKNIASLNPHLPD